MSTRDLAWAVIAVVAAGCARATVVETPNLGRPATAAQIAAVPLPGGSPTRSGPTLMAQPAIWAAVAGRPRFGVSTTVARAHPAATTAITAHARSRVDMLHLAVGGHAPGLDRVAVEDGVVAVVGDEPVAFGLHGPRVVGGARLQHARAAVPAPGQPEARERARQHERAQRRRGPRPPAVAGDLDPADRAAAGPGDPGNLVEPGALESHAVRRARDDRLHLHRVREHERPAVGLKVGIAGGLVLGHDRRRDHLEAPQPLHAHVALPPGKEQAHRIAVLRPQALAVLEH